MSIAWNQFTPWSSLFGGVLIGLSAALYLLGIGRVAGIAGIVASPLRALFTGGRMSPEVTRLLFIVGLMVAPWLWSLVLPLPSAKVDSGTFELALAGLLIGVGVRMGNGCTSGHGVCGLSRFSLRSLANVMAFMGAGFVAVYLIRHIA